VPFCERLSELILQFPKLFFEFISLNILCIYSPQHFIHLSLHLAHFLLREPSILLSVTALMCHPFSLVPLLKHLGKTDRIQISQLLHQLLNLSLLLRLLLVLTKGNISHLFLTPVHCLILEHLNFSLVTLETSYLLLKLINYEIFLS
jgi:hypothetical protein